MSLRKDLKNIINALNEILENSSERKFYVYEPWSLDIGHYPRISFMTQQEYKMLSNYDTIFMRMLYLIMLIFAPITYLLDKLSKFVRKSGK